MTQCGTFQDLRFLPKRKLSSALDKLGATIRAVRQELDLSMGDVARFLQCKVSRLSDLETGQETDPRYVFCPNCDTGTWRTCSNCQGRGYVEAKRAEVAG